MKHKLTWAMIIVNVIVFEIIFSMPDKMLESTFGMLDFSWGNGLQLWRWGTSLFVHADASHLFFNMIALYFFGKVLEEEMEPKKWLLIYFASGLAGNALYGLTSSMPAVGASGCIFGLMGAAMFRKPAQSIKIYVFPIPLGIIAVLFVLSQAAMASAPAPGDGIAYMAHIGGLAAGTVLMLYYEPKKFLKGFGIMVLLTILLVVFAPLFFIVLGIGQIIVDFFNLATGFVLYGAAKLLLSWIWV